MRTHNTVNTDDIRKLSSIEDRRLTDRVLTFDLDFSSLTLTCDLQSQESYGHDPYTYTLCLKKNVNDVAHYNFNAH